MDSIKFTDAAERVLVTFVQALLGFLIATPFDSVGFWQAFALAGVIAAANAVKTLLTLWVPTFKTFAADLVYRTTSTFLVVLAGFYAGAQWVDIIDYDWSKSAAYAALVAALAVLKGTIASAFVQDTITPASLAKVA